MGRVAAGFADPSSKHGNIKFTHPLHNLHINSWGFGVLGNANQESLVRLLLSMDAHLELKNTKSQTALHLAVLAGNT